MSIELQGKVALVTGASRGLGEGAARALAAAGTSIHAGGARRCAGRQASRARHRGQGRSCRSRGLRRLRAMPRSRRSWPRQGRAWGASTYWSTMPALSIPSPRLRRPIRRRGRKITTINLDRCLQRRARGAARHAGPSRRHDRQRLVGCRLPAARRLERLLLGQGRACHAHQGASRSKQQGRGSASSETAGTIDTDMQVKIRASGMNVISKIPRGNLSPVEHAVRGLVHLCTGASDDLMGQDASMRDEPFRKRIGL